MQHHLAGSLWIREGWHSKQWVACTAWALTTHSRLRPLTDLLIGGWVWGFHWLVVGSGLRQLSTGTETHLMCDEQFSCTAWPCMSISPEASRGSQKGPPRHKQVAKNPTQHWRFRGRIHSYRRIIIKKELEEEIWTALLIKAEAQGACPAPSTEAPRSAGVGGWPITPLSAPKLSGFSYGRDTREPWLKLAGGRRLQNSYTHSSSS